MQNVEPRVALIGQSISVRYDTWTQLGHSRVALLRRMLGSGNRSSIRAVKGVSLTAYEGESIGVVGRNGSGKSTLLRALAGLEFLDAGEVYARSRPQFLGISPALEANRSGIDNIKLGGLSLGLTPKEVVDAIPRITELAGLGEAIHQPISSYSSGMSARLRFAITTANTNREILFIDEALGAGDAAFQERSKLAVKDIVNNAGTVFVVSHAPRVIEQMCSRALWMHEGELVLDGEAGEVVDYYLTWSRHTMNEEFDEADRIIESALSLKGSS